MNNKTSFWLVKQEPSKYSWETFLQDGETYWDGVRNYQARNNLQSMRKGDLVFFYHSVIGKEIKGIAKVTREAYPDPTTDDLRWVVVDLKPLKTFAYPVNPGNCVGQAVSFICHARNQKGKPGSLKNGQDFNLKKPFFISFGLMRCRETLIDLEIMEV